MSRYIRILPLALTFVLALVVAFLHGALDFVQFVLFGATALLQGWVLLARKIEARILPLRRLRPDPGYARRTRLETIAAFLVSLTLPLEAMLAGGGWLLLATLSVAMLFWNVDPVSALPTRRRRLAEARKRFKEGGFRVVVYFAGAEGSAYQVQQWLPVLEALPFPVAILVRSLDVGSEIGAKRVPVYFVHDFDLLDALSREGPQVFLYPANPMQNFQALRIAHLKHVFINHGESDKAVNQSKFLLAYDALLVGGPLAERRLGDSGLQPRPGQVVHVGRPQAEIFLTPVVESGRPLRRVLYAPTWEGFGQTANYSSVGQRGIDILEDLASAGRFEVMFKPHPLTGSRSPEVRKMLGRMRALADRAGFRVVGSEQPIFDAMNWSDMLVTDVSSVLNDYLITRKPIVINCPAGQSKAAFRASFPSAGAAYVVGSGDSLHSLIASIEQDDLLASERHRLRVESLGDSDVPSLERFARAIEDHLV